MFGFIGKIIKGAANIAKNVFTIGAGVAVGAGIVSIINRARNGGGQRQLYQEPSIPEQSSYQGDIDREKFEIIKTALRNPVLIKESLAMIREKNAEEKLAIEKELAKQAMINEGNFLEELRLKSTKILTLDCLSDIWTSGYKFFGICPDETITVSCEGDIFPVHTSLIKYIVRAPLQGNNIIHLYSGSEYVVDSNYQLALNFWSDSGAMHKLKIGDNLRMIGGVNIPQGNEFVNELRLFVHEKERLLIDNVGVDKVREFIDLCESFLDSPKAKTTSDKPKKKKILPPAVISTLDIDRTVYKKELGDALQLIKDEGLEGLVGFPEKELITYFKEGHGYEYAIRMIQSSIRQKLNREKLREIGGLMLSGKSLQQATNEVFGENTYSDVTADLRMAEIPSSDLSQSIEVLEPDNQIEDPPPKKSFGELFLAELKGCIKNFTSQ